MKKEVYWESDIGQRVRIYRNLNNGLISLQHYIKNQGWILSGHLSDCILENVSFKVYETARLRVIKNQRKNVHAFAIGRLLGENPEGDIDTPVSLGYNPYEHDFFYDKNTGQKLENADYLVVRNNQVFVSRRAANSNKPSFIQMALDLFETPNRLSYWAAA